MAFFINTNIVSLNTLHKLTNTQNAIDTSFRRLSSGVRVNSAKDDAAGLGIANRMESIVRGQTVAIRNANDAISYAQTAEGALSQITELLQRMRELAVQSANATNAEADHVSLNTEFAQLQAEITRITVNTKFNGESVFAGSAKTFQIGSDTTADNQITTQGQNLIADTSATGNAAFINNGVTQATLNKARSAFIANGGLFDTSDGSPSAGDVAALAAVATAFENNIPTQDQLTYDAAKSAFMSAGGSFSASDGSAVMAKSGSATTVVMIAGVPVTQTVAVATASDISAFNAFKSAEFNHYAAAKGIQILDQPSSLSAIRSVDNALLEVQTEATLHGATQNRMSTVISNLQSSVENQAAARSRIMDADFATETASLAQHQILQRAGMAILAQANQSANIVLSLLQ
ncbi:flagellin [Methylomonas montana]|uniref:flagellin N-terminal helical domain-containing protein n=1 Tax=Methylomonas montana TaxID=3058963 RepID=UPI00265A77BC|nr:flagellin [Methylomonas montana]WKJ88883.1 flagellin [Methylomonas montana]